MVVWVANLDLNTYMNGLRSSPRNATTQNGQVDEEERNQNSNGGPGRLEDIPSSFVGGLKSDGEREKSDGVLDIPAGMEKAKGDTGLTPSPYQKEHTR